MTGRADAGQEPKGVPSAGGAAAGPDSAHPAAQSLGSRALRGSIWAAAGHGTSLLIRLGSNLILTRLLFPEAFGLMAIVFAFLTGLAMFSDLGLAPSIVQSSRGDDPRFLNTAWTLQIIRGIGLWVFSCLLAWPVADFYDQPSILGLLPVAGLGVLIAGFNSTSLPRLQRHLAVGKMTLVQLAGQVSSVAVMLVWALIHPTVWALVGGGLAGSVVTLVLSHQVVADRRDRFAWDRGAARDLFHFGKWIFISTVLAFLVGSSDRLIFGKLVSVATLGVYSIAAMFATLPTGVLHRVGSAVVFPAFSRKTEAMTGFESAYRRSRRPLLALGGLVVACIAASGPPLIETLYDPRYADAGWILQLLAFEAWFRILEVPSGSALLALGLPRWLAVANAFKLVGILALVPLGYWLYGFPGAIAGFAASEALRYAVCAAGAHRQGLPGAGADLLASALVAVAAGCGLYASFAIGQAGGENLERLAGSVLTAFLAWLPVAYFLVRREAARVAADLGFPFR
jgi:O-antigen/teichoic acid export membrane protein